MLKCKVAVALIYQRFIIYLVAVIIQLLCCICINILHAVLNYFSNICILAVREGESLSKP